MDRCPELEKDDEFFLCKCNKCDFFVNFLLISGCIILILFILTV